MDNHIVNFYDEEIENNQLYVDYTHTFTTEEVFNSRDDLLQWARKVGLSLGFVLIIYSSNKNPLDGRKPKLVIECNRHGNYHATTVSTKATSSKKISTEFNKKPRPTKMSWLQKIRAIIDLSTTPLIEPGVKIQSRGRPSSKNKVNESTQRNPSAFEYAKNAKNRKPVIMSGRHSCSSTDQFSGYQKKGQILYINQFPSYLHEYIISVNDVRSDGNCGFCAIALGMGYIEDAWVEVRYNMLEDLNNNEYEYNDMYGVYGRTSIIRNALSFFHRDRHAPKIHWLDLPDMGYLIASCYNIVFVLLSASGSMTFFPLRSALPPPQQRHLVCIGHVNGNHFVHISLRFNPPIPRPLQWYRIKHPLATNWGIIYEENFRTYQQLMDLISQNVPQQYINLDSD